MALALCCLAFAFAGAARAGPAPASTAAPGPGATPNASGASDEESLIARGLEQREKGDDAAALVSFRRAYEISKGARALAQIALAEQALGRWPDAEAHLGQSVARASDPWIERHKPLLEQALAEIQGHLGSLELSGGVPGAEVRVNGDKVGAFPLDAPIRVPAGSVALEVRAEGYLPVVRTVTVPNRGLARESVVLVALGPVVPPGAPGPAIPPVNDVAITTVGPEATTAAPASAGLAWSTRRKVAVALGAAAVAGVGVGTAFLVISNNHAGDFNDTIDAASPTGKCVTESVAPPCRDLHDQWKSALTTSIVGYAAAAVLGGAAAYLFFTDHPNDRGNVTVARDSFGLRCVPSATTGVVLACAGTF